MRIAAASAATTILCSLQLPESCSPGSRKYIDQRKLNISSDDAGRWRVWRRGAHMHSLHRLQQPHQSRETANWQPAHLAQHTASPGWQLCSSSCDRSR